MKCFVLIGALLAFNLMQEPATVPENLNISTAYDRFSDTTTVELRAYLGKAQQNPGLYTARLRVNGVIKGTDFRDQTPAVLLSLETRSEGWRYLPPPSARTLRVILDERERLLIGSMSRESGEVLTGSQVMELLVLIDVPFSVIEKLSLAQKIEMQVGTDEFEFLPSQIENLRQWVQRFSPPQVKPAPTSPLAKPRKKSKRSA